MSIVAPNIGLPIANPKAKNICIIPSIALYSLSPNSTPVIYDGPITYANKDIPKHIGNTYPRKFIFGINIKHKHAITTNIPAKEYDLDNPSLSNNIPPKIEQNIERLKTTAQKMDISLKEKMIIEKELKKLRKKLAESKTKVEDSAGTIRKLWKITKLAFRTGKKYFF